MSELESKESSEIFNLVLSNTIFNPENNPTEFVGNVERETKHIKMGSTSPNNLSACSEYLRSKGVETKDPSGAIDLSILRVLKLLPGIEKISGNGIDFSKYIFSNLVNEYVLPPEKQYLRARIYNSTLDQIMREKGAPVNIQRHITKQEMMSVLLWVEQIYNDIAFGIK